MCRKTGENAVKSLKYCSPTLTGIGILCVHRKKVSPEMSDVHIRFIRVVKVP